MFANPSHFIVSSSADLSASTADLPNRLDQLDRLTFFPGRFLYYVSFQTMGRVIL
jgi:hypothetical protein